MAISTIRRATADDQAAIERAAERFCTRHNITQWHDEQSFEAAIELEIDMARGDENGRTPRLGRLWQQCYCRALGQPYDARLTIAYGHVGIHCD